MCDLKQDLNWPKTALQLIQGDHETIWLIRAEL
jgi:hypothetical protein